jgi:hypothetical protein
VRSVDKDVYMDLKPMDLDMIILKSVDLNSEKEDLDLSLWDLTTSLTN